MVKLLIVLAVVVAVGLGVAIGGPAIVGGGEDTPDEAPIAAEVVKESSAPSLPDWARGDAPKPIPVAPVAPTPIQPELPAEARAETATEVSDPEQAEPEPDVIAPFEGWLRGADAPASASAVSEDAAGGDQGWGEVSDAVSDARVDVDGWEAGEWETLETADARGMADALPFQQD